MTGDASLLRGKTIVITGSSKGVGAAVAQAFGQEGATLILVGRRRAALEEVAERCWGLGAALCDPMEADLFDPAQIARLAGAVIEKYAGVDCLVNCAGAYPKNISLLEGDLEEWAGTVRLNLETPMRLTRLLAPGMVKKGEGVIINIGSVAGLKGVPDEAAYAASKAGLRRWSQACYEPTNLHLLAVLQALRPHNVKVCLIEPSHVETDMARQQEGTRAEKMLPENMLRPEDVAEAALLPFRLSAAGVPSEIVLNRLHSAMKK